MSAVINDRFTTEINQPFVVFLIGMRVNRFFAFRKWVQIASAFPQMVRVLEAHPEKGFMGAEQFFRPFPLTTIMVSYWRSFEALEHFARSKDDPHLEAWRRFNREVGTDGSVGIWHETYTVEPGRYEAFYGNMPLFGLAKATQKMVPFQPGSKRAARERLKGEPVPTGLEIYNE